MSVQHHPHLLRSPAAPRLIPARLHLPRQGPRCVGAGDAPALARTRGPAGALRAAGARRHLPPRAREPRALRHELRHRRPRRRLPLPPLAPRLPHRLPRLHGRLALPLLPPRRAARPLRPRHRGRRRARRALGGNACPAPAHRRHRQHPHLAARRARPRPDSRPATPLGGEHRRGGRAVVHARPAAARVLVT